MAAEIHSRPQSSRPGLLSKIEGHQDAVTAALLIPQEDGVITASEDRSAGHSKSCIAKETGFFLLLKQRGQSSADLAGRKRL